jgi:hypothetical protein
LAVTPVRRRVSNVAVNSAPAGSVMTSFASGSRYAVASSGSLLAVTVHATDASADGSSSSAANSCRRSTGSTMETTPSAPEPSTATPDTSTATVGGVESMEMDALLSPPSLACNSRDAVAFPSMTTAGSSTRDSLNTAWFRDVVHVTLAHTSAHWLVSTAAMSSAATVAVPTCAQSTGTSSGTLSPTRR